MLILLASQLERVGFLIAMAFLFSRQQKLRQFMRFQGEDRNLWRFIFLFSFFAILGSYAGVRVTGVSYYPAPWITHVSNYEAICTFRTIGIVIAGLFGGVKAGFIVGTIAGVHRYTLGGFVAFPCMVSPIFEGIFAGLMKNSLKKRYRHISSIQLSFLVGFAAESFQMVMILLLAHPFDKALTLVELIALPQILSNSVGVASFFAILIQVDREEERIGALHAKKALQIAERTLSYWRKPLHEAVLKIGKVLIQETDANGVIFQQNDHILFQTGKITPFGVDLAVGYGSHNIGFFRIFYEREQDRHTAEGTTIISGLSQLFSQQYALVEAERQAHLVTNAEIKALQAQMNPHFLFNVLNTIKSLIRTSPEDARQMITNLAKYLRKNMQSVNQDLITIEEELEHVKIYLNLVKARIGEKIQIEWDVDENYLEYTIPSLTIQPLTENAIIHGLKGRGYHGNLRISVKRIVGGIQITVADNGVGMDETLDKKSEDHMGFALTNIKQRLFYHYGEKCRFKIDSHKGKGTAVSFVRPVKIGGSLK